MQMRFALLTPLLAGQLAGHCAQIVLLVAVGAWFGRDGGWEPIVVGLGFVMSCMTTGAMVLRTASRVPEPVTDVMNAEEFAETLFHVIDAIPAFGEDARSIKDMLRLSRSRDNAAGSTVLAMLRSIGVVTVDMNGHVSAVSERARAFAQCLALSARSGVPFLGDWAASDVGGAENDKLKRILREAESFRLGRSGSDSSASRCVESALVLIKAKSDGPDCYLMQWSDAWGDRGYYWFIGGIREFKDRSIEECAYRELYEELGIERATIHGLTRIGTVTDRRLSERIGALTEYQYTVFAAVLNGSTQRVQELHRRESVTGTAVSWVPVGRRNRWHTWDEICASEDLQRDAGRVLELLTKVGGDAIPYSTSLSVFD